MLSLLVYLFKAFQFFKAILFIYPPFIGCSCAIFHYLCVPIRTRSWRLNIPTFSSLDREYLYVDFQIFCYYALVINYVLSYTLLNSLSLLMSFILYWLGFSIMARDILHFYWFYLLLFCHYYNSYGYYFLLYWSLCTFSSDYLVLYACIEAHLFRLQGVDLSYSTLGSILTHHHTTRLLVYRNHFWHLLNWHLLNF